MLLQEIGILKLLLLLLMISMKSLKVNPSVWREIIVNSLTIRRKITVECLGIWREIIVGNSLGIWREIVVVVVERLRSSNRRGVKNGFWMSERILRLKDDGGRWRTTAGLEVECGRFTRVGVRVVGREATEGGDHFGTLQKEQVVEIFCVRKCV